jgi:hypothetical protein
MRNLVSIAAALALIASSTAYAAWSGVVGIVSIEASDVTSGGGVWLYMSQNPFPNQWCTNNGGQYRLGGSTDNIKQMTTLAISAKTSSRPIRVFWNGGCDAGGYPLLLGIELR